MKRILAAAALAALALPAGAFEAAAGPAIETTFSKTYTLGCALNASDGEALKVRLMVKNITGRLIAKGTPITLHFDFGDRPGQRPNGPRQITATAWRDVVPGASIGFDQQPRFAKSCGASVTLSRSGDVIKRTR
jgi:hypothetical protein